eukprot:3116739-Prymnesium_polylepis.1
MGTKSLSMHAQITPGEAMVNPPTRRTSLQRDEPQNRSAHTRNLTIIRRTCCSFSAQSCRDLHSGHDQPPERRIGRCRGGPGLYIAQTKLTDASGQRLPFRGLFTGSTLPPGAFVGLYTGDFFTAENYAARPDSRRRNEYAISISGDVRCDDIVVSPPVKRGTVDAASYPIALANEPGPYETANCVL